MTQRPAGSRVQHGEPTCADYGCRREECLDARRLKRKRNRLLRQTGRPGMVPAARAAKHIARFRAASLEDNAIIVDLGIARTTFYRVMRGEPLSRRTEQRILSVPAPKPVDEVVTLVKVPAVGTHRRMRALLRQGWPPGELERRLGVHMGWMAQSSRHTSVTTAMRTRVAALYDELWNVRPEDAGVQAGRARSTRELAVEAGYYGPLAWDDDTIDDPDTMPQTDALAPSESEGPNLVDRWLMGESVILGRVERGDALVHLFEWSELSPDEIAARLDMTASAASRAWERHKEKAREAGRPVPWRRRYALRNKDLTMNEMGAAA